MKSDNASSPELPLPPNGGPPVFSVGDLSRQIKGLIEDTFAHVRVRGEIGECKIHTSGHLYLSLKDETAVLAAVCWRGQMSKLGLRPEMGMDVICTGRLTTYAGQSKYQLVITSMELAGRGALLKMLEDRRRKLAAEGLFDASRKKPLPFLPNVIGVVTSPTGAVIRDILHRLEDRFPRHVIVWPVAVQGTGAAEQIANAIHGFNALPEDDVIPRPDLLIVARGGGSLEDLMPFNEEVVVRAAAASAIPLISAVGHETDTTLIDYAADHRAPTPTAAAEIAVPVREGLLAQTLDDGARLDAAMLRLIQERKARMNLIMRAIGDPARVLEPLMQRVDERTERLLCAWKNFAARHRSQLTEAASRLRHPRDVAALAAHRLEHQAHRLQSIARERLLQAEKRLERSRVMLEALSPRAVLQRGYTLVRDAAGHVFVSAKTLKTGSAITIDFHDGSREAVVKEP